jgi:predicted RNA binding protein YcfA (HicA-like mRNA interferase family)
MPTIKSAELVRFLKAKGFEEDRQRGSHLTLWHSENKIGVTVSIHSGTDLGRGLTNRLLKDAGFTKEDYINWR